MPIKLRKNQYRGVNAHLHSILQVTFAGWEEWHSAHIIHIAEFIDGLLPVRYLAKPQRSFQITTIAAEARATLISRLAKPDIAVYERHPSESVRPASLEATAPTMTLPTVEVFDNPEDYLGAVAVVSKDKIGETVAWIELLSPSNKPPGFGYDEYNEKRLAALLNGIVMVEIDYLHQSRPVIRRLPPYPNEGSYPYYIAVTDPRPIYREGYVDIYGFAVDQPISKVLIPLLDQDSITVDFGAIYNHTFESLRTFGEQVDYEQEPPRMDAYHPDDQEYIHAMMAAVKKAVESAREEA